MADERAKQVGTEPTLPVEHAAGGTMTSPHRSSQPAAADPPPRAWIGRYKVIAKLGAGGMGVVYAAEDPELDRKVAIKLLHGASETASARLVREAKALAKLRHPNVVTIYEVGRDAGDAFVAMELVEGVTLRAWLGDEHPVAARLDAMIQAGRGLAAAHAEGLVHRDFKPENVMVGRDGRVQVLDFGLAKSARAPTLDPDAPPPAHAAPSEATLDELTRTGTLLGTPAYMAPEQFAAGPTDARTDQFAYCVALFEALHGFRPFAGTTHAALAEAVTAGRIVQDRALSAQVPAHVQAAILRGLAVSPADRFPDMPALLAALQARRATRSRWLVGLAAAAAIAAGGAAWALTRSSPADAREALFAASGVPAPQPTPVFGDPFKVTVHRLSNGLSVWISPNRKSPRIDARLVLRAGSRDANGVGGLAHMVEHMTYKGTPRVGTVDFARESQHLATLRRLYTMHAAAPAAQKDALLRQIDAETVLASKVSNAAELSEAAAALGIRNYGATTEYDSTVFRADIPSNKFALWAKLEGERLSEPVFRAFHVEAGVVFDEIHAGRSASPLYAVTDELLATAFAGHPYALSPGGSFADIVAEPFVAAEAFHRAWYVPNNAALLLAGDIDPAQAIPVLERELGRWQPRALPARAPRPVAPLAGEVRRTVKGLQLPLAVVGWHTAPQGHADEDALYVMSTLLDRLGLAYAGRARVQAYPMAMTEAGLFVATALPVGGHTPDEATAALEDVVRALQTGDFSDELLAGVLLNETIRLDRAHDTNDTRIERMIAGYLAGRGWEHASRRKARINGVTKADIVRVAKQYLTKNRVVIVGEAGSYDVPVANRPKVSPLDTTAKRQSTFVRDLLAEESVEIPPRFVSEGRDYQVAETAAGPLVAVANHDDTQYVLRMHWDLGSRDLPLVCAAIHVLDHAGIGETDVTTRRSRWYARAQTATAGCYGSSIEIEVTGVDGTFDEDWQEVERWLAGDGITDAVWKSGLAEYQDYRAWSRSDSNVIPALDYFAAFGAQSPRLAGADTAALARATAADARAALKTLVATRRSLAYFGPRAIEAVRLPPAIAVTRAAPPLPRVVLQPVTGTRILTLDTGPNRSVSATIRVGLGAREHGRLGTAHVFANYLSDSGNGVLWNAFRNVRGITFSGGSAWIEEALRPDDEASLLLRFSTGAAELPEALELALAALRDANIDRAQARAAQHRAEEVFRASWIAPRELATSVAAWRARGFETDPRRVMFEQAQRTTERDLGQLAEELARAKTYVTITGDVSAIDGKRLRALGQVEAIEVAAIFAP